MHRRNIKRHEIYDGLPVPKDNQFVAKVICTTGVQNCQVAIPLLGPDSSFLVFLPTKFRNAAFIRRGSFLIVEQFPSDVASGKLFGEIKSVLLPDQIGNLVDLGLFPFPSPVKTKAQPSECDDA